MSVFEFMVFSSAVIIAIVLGEIRLRCALTDVRQWVRELLFRERETTNEFITTEINQQLHSVK